jgi:hypothetical protein
VAYVVRPDQRLGCIFVRYEGDIGETDLRAVVETLAGDPALRELPRRLHDLRAARLTLSGVEVRALAERSRQLARDLGAARRSALLTPEPAVFGQARMYQSYTDGLERALGVFRSFAEAAAWLGLPDDTRDPFETSGGGRER